VVVVHVGVCGGAGEKQVPFEDDRKKGKGKGVRGRGVVALVRGFLSRVKL